MKTKQKIELLAPAGNLKCLNAAVLAGADAVYLGLQEFNMRRGTQNFKLIDLPKIRRLYPKLKIYLTLNTIIYNKELKKVEQIIKKAKPYINAIICWDLAVIQLCKKYKVPIHISTQSSVSNIQAAKFYKKLGAKRIILARELNLKQIKKISTILPVEIFGHGAMCVSISGRCFTSQFLHNKSANRGKCMHPCRKTYTVTDEEGNQLKVNNNKIFSAKDLCTLPFIEKIKRSGISALKIEGRNREPEYVYIVTKVYKQALDKKLTKQELAKSLTKLKQVYNREFSSGFYIKLPTADDLTKTEHGSQTKTKKFIGKITHYWPKPKVAKLKLNAGKLKIGDKVQVVGNTTFFRTKIKSMEINHKQIKQAKKTQEIGIKLQRCRKGDDLYLILKK